MKQITEKYLAARKEACEWFVGKYRNDPCKPAMSFENAERELEYIAEVERLRNAIWPGLPNWEPTAEKPKQDFHEAVIEAMRKDSREHAEAARYLLSFLVNEPHHLAVALKRWPWLENVEAPE